MTTSTATQLGFKYSLPARKVRVFSVAYRF